MLQLFKHFWSSHIQLLSQSFRRQLQEVSGGLIQILVVIQGPMIIHGLVWFTDEQATLGNFLNPLRSELARSHQHHGIHWAVGHAVSFHIQVSDEVLTISGCFPTCTFLQSMQPHKSRLLTDSSKRTTNGCNELSRHGGRLTLDVSIRGQPITHLFQHISQRTSKHGIQFLGHISNRHCMNLDTKGLAQSKSHCITMLGIGTREIQYRTGGQHSFTHQLVGLRVVLAQHLHTAYAGHVVGIVDWHLTHSNTTCFSTSRHLGVKADQFVIGSSNVLVTAFSRLLVIHVHHTILKIAFTKDLDHSINTHRTVHVDHVQVQLEWGLLFSSKGFLLFCSVQHIGPTQLSVRNLCWGLANVTGCLWLNNNRGIQQSRIFANSRLWVSKIPCWVHRVHIELTMARSRIRQHLTCIVNPDVVLQKNASVYKSTQHFSSHCLWDAINVADRGSLVAIEAPILQHLGAKRRHSLLCDAARIQPIHQLTGFSSFWEICQFNDRIHIHVTTILVAIHSPVHAC